MPYAPAFARKHRLSLMVSLCIVCLLFWKAESLRVSQLGHSTPSHLPCWSLSGGNETLVILRTGSTEIKDRFPVHAKTTLRCYPHCLVFSDLEEEFAGEHIIDALESVSPEIKAKHDDFALYRRLKQHGRAAFDPSELSGSDSKVANPTGEQSNPGWKLDKWKFLPMMNRTIYEYPHMKWYVFVEADTYILWSMLLRYLATLDPSKPYYGGDELSVGDDKFAHGGTGFIVSRPALRAVVAFYATHKTEVEALVDGHCAGDCVLGKVFLDAGVPMTDMFPIMQGNHPGLVPYGIPNDYSVPEEPWMVWCSPTVSYHHMSVSDVGRLWQFEQRWIADRLPDIDLLHHKDIFKHFVMPQMTVRRDELDNGCDQEQADVASFKDCQKMCEASPDCKQYSYDQGGECRTRVNPRLGMPKPGVTSGWIMERVERFMQEMSACRK